MQSPSDYTFSEITEGTSVSEDYCITSVVYENFLKTFGDLSPIHIDDRYARECGFRERVMHGAILNGFLSHFIGMRFPGRRALWLSQDLRFLKPCYLCDQIQLQVTVTQKVEANRVLVLGIVFHNQTQHTIAARGRVQVALRDA